ncbi:hypothetical protein [Alloyangia pacifica]|uniref:hypothetical protein n=1 Tax=Alloyangia pacifica TaxID=311180 RepID=UPI0031D87A57
MNGCLLTLAGLLSGTAPGATLFAMMRRPGPFSRYGSAERRVVRALGIEGSGPTWDEAARKWAEGARWLATQPAPVRAPVQLDLLELAA